MPFHRRSGLSAATLPRSATGPVIRPPRQAVLILVACLALTGCTGRADGPKSPGIALAEARERWAAATITDYTMRYRSLAYWDAHEDATVRVSDAGVVVVEPPSDAEPDDRRFPIQSVESMFTTIERAIAEADELQVLNHPELGYPIQFSIDWVSGMADDETGAAVASLAPGG